MVIVIFRAHFVAVLPVSESPSGLVHPDAFSINLKCRHSYGGVIPYLYVANDFKV